MTINDTIAARYASGAKDREIAAEVGLSANAVRQRRHRLGLVRRTRVDRDRLRQLWRQGLTGPQLALELGCSHRYIQQLCWTLGLNLRGERDV